MMQKFLSAALVAGGALAAASFTSPRAEGPEIGAPAPEIAAKTWFNHIGRPITLESLRGQAVMLEFWATWCGPCVAAWPHVQEIHDEYREKGLVVLALSNEVDEKVSAFLDQNGYSVPTAAGSTSGGAYGVSGIPRTFLIDPSGKIAWSGHPSEVSKSLLQEVTKGAKKRSSSVLAIQVDEEPAGRLAAHAKAMAAGNPGKALTALQAFADDPKATEAEKSGAAALVTAIEEHVGLLNREADKLLGAREVLRGLAILDALAKEFTGPIGEAAKKRAAEVRKDDALAKEIAGAEALARAQEQAKKLGSTKARSKFEEVVEKHKGTRAAERAAVLLRGKKG
ncbi:MAG: redoxin domain-containing protein [Planctomycetes bacterium]|nr:redoxin domain-containing protein [Planctomycetota bacterium]